VTAVACGGGEDEGAAGDTATVVMELVAFEPEQLEVEAGTTVTWEQRDVGDHTVTSGTVEQGAAGVTGQPDDRFESGRLSTDDSFEHRFDEPGTYSYFCSLHPATMRGEIRVT
jgi:plastocyanin